MFILILLLTVNVNVNVNVNVGVGVVVVDVNVNVNVNVNVGVVVVDVVAVDTDIITIIIAAVIVVNAQKKIFSMFRSFSEKTCQYPDSSIPVIENGSLEINGNRQGGYKPGSVALYHCNLVSFNSSTSVLY